MHLQSEGQGEPQEILGNFSLKLPFRPYQQITEKNYLAAAMARSSVKIPTALVFVS